MPIALMHENNVQKPHISTEFDRTAQFVDTTEFLEQETIIFYNY